MKKIIVAIDGYSACGKSTTARLSAADLGYAYIDTGAMYRAVTLYFLENYINVTNPVQVQSALEDIDIKFLYSNRNQRNETYLNGLNVEEEIRKMEVTRKVSEVSALSAVREKMVSLQQKMGKKRGIVMDGRDIGTHVFPDAEVKIFMTADLEVRAQRRQQELLEKNIVMDLDEVVEDLKERDRLDTTRSESPLRRAEGAYILDNTYMSIDEQIEYVTGLVAGELVKTLNE